jgi:peptidoglycan/LPS O-acetylase OafA/YrhL
MQGEWAAILLSGVLISALVRGVGSRLLTPRPLVFLGTVSYEIYFCHLLMPHMIYFIERTCGVSLLIPSSELGQCIYYFAASLILSTVCWHYIEVPINALKLRLPYPVAQVSNPATGPVPA